MKLTILDTDNGPFGYDVEHDGEHVVVSFQALAPVPVPSAPGAPPQVAGVPVETFAFRMKRADMETLARRILGAPKVDIVPGNIGRVKA